MADFIAILSLCSHFLLLKPGFIERMIQLHNFFFFLIFLVVLCGTAAPVLLKWFFSRDVSTGAPSFNGTIIPIPISLFSLLIYLHSRKIIRSMDGAGVLVSASRPFVLADVIGSSETLARKVLFLCVPVVHFCLLKSKVVLDFSYLESFCGVLCLLFFCTFFFLTDLKGERTRRRKGQRLWNELRRNDKISKHLERKVEGPLSFSIGQGGSVVPGVPQEMVPFTLPRNQQLITKAVSHYLPMKMIISHGGVCIFMLGVLLSNAKKIQLTQRLPLGSELDMGSERCCLRGLDHLHGPTSHSICGNLMIYKPASLRLKKDHLMFGDDSSYNNGKLEHFMNWWNRRHRHFGLSMFPEKRYFGERASTAEVAIHTNLFTDLYASIGTGSSRTGGWYTTIMKLPFIFLIWIGFLLASLGGSPSLLRQLKKSKLRWNRTQVHKCIIENSVEVNE